MKTRKHRNTKLSLRGQTVNSAVLILMALTILISSNPRARAGDEFGDSSTIAQASPVEDGEQQHVNLKEADGKVVGIKNVCVHVLKLEKTLELYRDILGFEMKRASVLHGEGIEGMLVMELHAGNCAVHLSLPAPGSDVGEIGNTNHNHFMLVVDNIVPICDRLKEEGYALENEAYARDKYSFFTGPNGEIVGLTENR